MLGELPKIRKPGDISKLAKKHGLPQEKVRKLCVLANEKRGFTKAELEDQFQRFRETGMSLTVSHFIRSLAIKRGNLRKEALRAALDQNLSSHHFQSWITSVQPNRKGAGRRPKSIISRNFDQTVGGLVWNWERHLATHLEVNRISNPELGAAVLKLQSLMKKIIGIAQGKPTS